jgi:perosamine synthetase
VNEPIPLARPDLGSREEELVLEVLRSGSLSLGPVLERFESSFANWLGVADAVAVSSGTAALHLGVRQLGWKDGDEVLTTPFSFVASANCLLYEGARPVFCDIDERTLNLDVGAATDAVGEGTAGILPVHIFGYPANMPAIESLATSKGLGVLEDACQALGTVDSEGRRTGTRGNPTAFAFYANKQITTGEGGVVVPTGESMATALRSERNQGRDPDMSRLDHDRLGYNYRLTELSAAIGLAQIERADELLQARARVAGLYNERLAQVGAPAGDGDRAGLVLPCADRGDERRSWFVYPVQLPEGADRDRVIDRLQERGVAAKAYLPCIHLQPPYRERFGFRGGEFPVAERVSSRSVALPFYTAMDEPQVDRVCKALAEALGNRS